MAGTFTDFWRIVKPASSKVQYNATSPEAAKLYSNFSWYTKVMKGASSRFSKYNQYKNMDSDVFVARSLDTIAEEMTPINGKTNLPFEIMYQNENNEEVPESITMTVRAALRHWSETQDFNTILFDIARTTVMFGDCFFRKTSDFKKWQYIDPSDIIGISIDEDGKPEHYHVRVGEKNKQGAFGDVVMLPAAGIVHFSMTSSMGESGPFGESVLSACVKAFRHLSLLEDSVIIYRIVRAPERRVFFIDTGNMPPQRVKAYLEAIKLEMKQKRIPNETGGTDKVDSVYNPMCLTLDTKIPLLDGRTLPLYELILEQAEGRQNWVYSTDPSSGKIAPGLISWAGVTRKDADIVKINLDNGKTITCTPDHKFPTLNRGFVQAIDLLPSDSLISYEIREKKIGSGSSYQQVFDHESNTWKFTHRIVGEFFKSINKHQEMTFSPEFLGEEKTVVHHKDYDSKNNHPINLQWMNKVDHMLYHKLTKKEWWSAIKGNASKLAELKLKISSGLERYYAGLSAEQRSKISVDATIRINEWVKRLSQDSTWVEKIQESRKLAGEKRSARMKQDPVFNEHITSNLKNGMKLNNAHINVPRDVVGRLTQLVVMQDLDRKQALKIGAADPLISRLLFEANKNSIGKSGVKFNGKLSEKVLQKIYSQYGYAGWKHFKQAAATYNHRVLSVELLAEKQDTGCITIDGDHKYHSYHTFALEAGVFTKNSMIEDYFFSTTSEGRGSRVETLSGGENLGEIADLNFFQNKFLQGLRIPSSYMRGGSDGGIAIADGKVGVAYIEELRFANYISRLQGKLNDTFDSHFKAYMKSAGLNIDHQLFKIKLVDPQNFTKYKQAEVDEKMIANYTSLKDVEVLSERFKLMHYLGLSEDDIQENESMLKQERAIPDGGVSERLNDLRMMYDKQWIENRPEIKVDDSYEDFTDETKKEPEASDETEATSDLKDEGEEGGKKEPAADEAAPDGEKSMKGGDENAEEAPAKDEGGDQSSNDVGSQIDKV